MEFAASLFNRTNERTNERPNDKEQSESTTAISIKLWIYVRLQPLIVISAFRHFGISEIVSNIQTFKHSISRSPKIQICVRTFALSRFRTFALFSRTIEETFRRRSFILAFSQCPHTVPYFNSMSIVLSVLHSHFTCNALYHAVLYS